MYCVFASSHDCVIFRQQCRVACLTAVEMYALLFCLHAEVLTFAFQVVSDVITLLQVLKHCSRRRSKIGNDVSQLSGLKLMFLSPPADE